MNLKKSSPITRFSMIALVLVITLSLLGSAVQPAVASAAEQTSAADTSIITIVSVVKSRSVTIQVVNMPANKEFQVRMNDIGTKGVDGVIAGKAKTNSQGSFTATFSIPARLKEKSTIAIRIETTDKTGWYAYNWFYNRDNRTSGSGSGTSTGTSTGTGIGAGIPAGNSGTSLGSITLVSIEEDKSVSFKVKSAPANSTLNVWMDWKNRKGVLIGVRVGSVKSDQSGSASATFKMPSAVQDRPEVRLRLQGPGTYLAYKWFVNGTSDDDTGGGAPSSYTGGIPYLRVIEVVEDDTVTIEARNFPKGEYEIFMGKMGTQGKKGIEVETVKNKKNGTFTVTVDIPDDLWNRDEIAIRVQGADDDDYYAYTWFENDTTSD